MNGKSASTAIEKTAAADDRSRDTDVTSLQVDQEKRLRREIANSNERRRMQSINAGFQTLRSLLPKKGEKMSKVSMPFSCCVMVVQGQPLSSAIVSAWRSANWSNSSPTTVPINRHLWGDHRKYFLFPKLLSSQSSSLSSLAACLVWGDQSSTSIDRCQ
ncbi:HLH domain containing protein [Trichuris trichiura]|uniref:HLH domain containing protein n=1 Tax=Trichuris trichiura TaxID=36087 RepID=A0A077Z9G7_TRITR|nr:HLH domain containing protein [Trichuris trichiura]